MVQHFCRNSTLLRLSALSSHIHSPLLLLQDPHGHREARRKGQDGGGHSHLRITLHTVASGPLRRIVGACQTRQRQAIDDSGEARQRPAAARGPARCQGLLSRAASQLCSRGIAPFNPETMQKVQQLFPAGELPLDAAVFETPAFEFQPAEVKKAILSSPKGLAAGCSGTIITLIITYIHY